MSNIYFLGREDAEGLARLQKRGVLSYDAEVGGWDNMRANEEMPMLAGRETFYAGNGEMRVTEPALRVFDSRSVQKEDTPKDEKESWPTITYQVRFGSDQ